MQVRMYRVSTAVELIAVNSGVTGRKNQSTADPVGNRMREEDASDARANGRRSQAPFGSLCIVG